MVKIILEKAGRLWYNCENNSRDQALVPEKGGDGMELSFVILAGIAMASAAQLVKAAVIILCLMAGIFIIAAVTPKLAELIDRLFASFKGSGADNPFVLSKSETKEPEASKEEAAPSDKERDENG